MGERIELVFIMGASFHPSYTLLKGNSGISKIRVLSSGIFFKLRTLKIRFGKTYRPTDR